MSPHRAALFAGRLLLSLCLLAAPSLATSAFAEYEAGSFGGGGGAEFHASCTPKALAALYAFVGSALDRVDVICGTLHGNGTVADVRPTGAYVGGGGGKLQGQYCPENALVTGMKVWMDYNKMVNGFILRCTYMTNGIETWTTMRVGGEHYGNPKTILCKKNEIAIGIYGRAGSLIDKLGLLCADNPMKVATGDEGGGAAAPPPPCPEGQIRLKGICQVPPLLPGTSTGTGGGFIQMFPEGGAPAVLLCRGGGGMRVAESTQTAVSIAFTPAVQAANIAPPGPGQCAWQDRVFAANEAHRFALDPSEPNAQLLFDAVRAGGTFQVTAVPSGALIMVHTIDNVQVVDSTPLSPGPVAAGGDEGNDAAGADDTPPVATDGSCGGPGAVATVVIPEPNLHALNLRSRPGGQVLGTVPEGAEVTVAGPCGSPAAAGFAKSTKPLGGAAGWCQLEAPASGCVMAKYLDFSGGGGGDAAGFAPAAGFAKPKTPGRLNSARAAAPAGLPTPATMPATIRKARTTGRHWWRTAHAAVPVGSPRS